MKKLVYLLSCLFLLSADFAACSSDTDDPPEQPSSHQNETPVDSIAVNNDTTEIDSTEAYTVISAVPASEEVKAFFDEALPYLPNLPLELSPFSFSPNKESEFFVINNEQEFRDIYKVKKDYPQLDYEHYTLIIGQMLMNGASYYLETIELRNYEEKSVLTIYTREPQYLYCTLYNMYFWAVFPKFEDDIDRVMIKQQ